MKKVFGIISIFILLLSLTSCVFGSKKSGSKLIDFSEEYVEFYKSQYEYTGSAITIEKNIKIVDKEKRYVSETYFNFEYENNINPGTASVKITAKDDNPKFKGSITLNFDITPANSGILVSTFEELKEAATNPKARFITVKENIDIPEGETISVGKNIDIRVGEYKKKEYTPSVKLTNYGTINVLESGFINVGGIGSTCYLYNYGTINVSGSLVSNSNSTIFNSGTIDSTNGKVSVYSGLYSNSEVKNVTKYSGGIYRVRKNVCEEEIIYSNTRYKEGAFANQVSFRIDDVYISTNDIEYLNTDKVGTATANIHIADNDYNFYGERTINYEILKGTTSVKNADELLAKKATKNYNEYEITTTSTVTINNDFVVDSDETISSNASLTFKGDFTNNGVINMTNNTYNILSSEYNTFTNNGTINLNSGRLNASNSTVINGNENNNTAAINGPITSLNLNNYGNINVENESGYITIRDNTSNYGNITSSANLTFKNLNNYGSIDANRAFYINEGSSFINQEDATINLNSNESVFKGTIFTNKGTINNKINTSLRQSYETITNSGTINNTGMIYAFKNINGVNDNFVLKKLLTTENTSLEYDNITYDESVHKPDIYIEGVIPDFTDISHSITYKYNGASDTTKLPKDVGVINERLVIYSEFYKYAGEVTLQYRINYASKHITSEYNFASIVGNTNYNQIYLDVDVELKSSSTLVLSNHQTLDLNGHSLILSSPLRNDGKIIVRKVNEADTLNTMEEVALLVGHTTYGSYTPSLTNNGTIENYSLILVNNNEKTNAKLNSETYSTIKNYGNIYTNEDTINISSDSTGNVIKRKALSASSVTLAYNETYYTGSELEPAVTVKYNSTILDSDLFNYTYSNNINAGEASVVTATINNLNMYYYGLYENTFDIKKSIKEIYDFNEELDGDNYYKFLLKQNVNLSNKIITIPEYSVLDLDIYRITFTSSKIIFSEGSTLAVSVSTMNDLKSFMFVANKITLTNDIGTLGEQAVFTYSSSSTSFDNESDYNSAMSTFSNYVYISNLEKTFFNKQYYGSLHKYTYSQAWFVINGNDIKYYEGLHMFNTAVDMNGYSILSNIKYDLYNVLSLDSKLLINVKFENSSTTESIIGSIGQSTFGFDVYGTSNNQGYHGDSTFTFDNITICGFRFKMEYLNGDVHVNATNTSFRNTTLSALAIEGDDKDKTQVNYHFSSTFTNCSFRSQKTAVIIRSFTNTFTNCTISSTGGYDDTSSTYSGSGMYVAQTTGSSDRNIIVNLNNTSINSTNGYGIVFYKKNSLWTTYTEINYNANLISSSKAKYFAVVGA